MSVRVKISVNENESCHTRPTFLIRFLALLEGYPRIWGSWGRMDECVIENESCHTFASLSHVTHLRLQFYPVHLEGCWRIWGPWSRMNKCVIENESCHTFASPTVTILFCTSRGLFVYQRFVNLNRVSEVREFAWISVWWKSNHVTLFASSTLNILSCTSRGVFAYVSFVRSYKWVSI